MTNGNSNGQGAPRRRVLVIEDEPDIARGLRDALEFEQFDVSTSSHGREGIKGLRERGADDYVTKPFSIGELIARINAIFRRLYRSVSDDAIQIGQATIFPRRHELVRNRKTVTLSFYEVEILRLLHERAGEPVSREEILEKIWGVSGYGSSRSVDNFVVKLRKKIEVDASSPRHIVTIYGTGYKLLA